MSDKGRLFMTLLLGSFIICANTTYASKTTELMSGALKQRSNGNINAAIKGFKQAVDEAPSILQRNLALFMLGDCQMEVSKYSDAVITYSELSKKATTADERAEALYKLMEANSNLGKSEEVSKAYSELKRRYPNSSYREVGEAFMKAEKIMESEYTGSIPLELPKTTKEESANQTTKVAKKQSNTSNNKTATSNTSKTETKSSPKAEAKPSSKTETKTAKAEPAKSTPKTASNQSSNTSGGKKLDAKTTAILEEIIIPESVSDAERDNLVSKILSYQDKLKDGEKGDGKDKILLQLAESTEKFGELLEACKTYDKILSLHPTSPLVEQAYYQSIRLRAILGVHQTVIDWARAFNITFPNSKYKNNISALVAYSQAGGKVQLSNKPKSTQSASNKTSSQNSKSTTSSNKTETAGLEAANTALKASSLYKNATQKMNDGQYSSALNDLKVLSSKFGDSSQLWWDTTLVYVQLEEFKEADKSIRKMLLLEPDNSDANSLLGYIQYRLENYDEAASAYDQAGEAEGEGVTFFDAKSASERLRKTSGAK